MDTQIRLVYLSNDTKLVGIVEDGLPAAETNPEDPDFGSEYERPEVPVLCIHYPFEVLFNTQTGEFNFAKWIPESPDCRFYIDRSRVITICNALPEIEQAFLQTTGLDVEPAAECEIDQDMASEILENLDPASEPKN